MNLGVRAKLFLISIALIAISVATADVFLTPAIADRLTAAARTNLLSEARLIAREVSLEGAPSPAEEAPWEPLAHDLGQTGDTRVTFIRADGVVLGDSALSAADVTRMENHATRPEVEEIRGTSLSQQTLDSLLEADLIAPKGRRESPGRPTLWGTTPHFLAQFGLRDLRDLPRREDLLLEPTVVAAPVGQEVQSEEGATLSPG